MNDNEINIAIAEAVKWRPSVDSGICWDDNGNPIVSPPSYTADLNAMHEAEATLPFTKRMDYLEWLGLCEDEVSSKIYHQVHSTARQRAEAFLRTLGKWKD